MSSVVKSRISPEHRSAIEKYTKNRPVSLASLARELGVKVSRSKMPVQISGKIQSVEANQDAPSGFEIKVNKYESPKRQRFTVAHELGHYLLHRDKINGELVDNIMYRSKLSSKLEAEANALAAELIMPQHLIRQDVADYGFPTNEEELDEFAERYNVSRDAMKIRLGMT